MQRKNIALRERASSRRGSRMSDAHKGDATSCEYECKIGLQHSERMAEPTDNSQLNPMLVLIPKNTTRTSRKLLCSPSAPGTC
jgi:hypothetical protein